MFSRPVSSWWNPTPTEMSGATRPRTDTRPFVGAVIPASSRIRVDLPEPLCPMTPTHSPSDTVKSTSRSAHSSERAVLLRKRNAWVASNGVSSNLR